MNILLLGAQGQLGWELGASLSPLGQVIHYGREQADLTDQVKLEKLVRQARPGVIVNAAAHTEVDQAEAEPRLAGQINAEAPARLAALAKDSEAWLVHYSTDYVFDGRKDGWYTEDDPPAPLNVYGRTKLEGDQAIQASGCRHLIFRTSWVFSAHTRNFPRSILELAFKEESFAVTADQFGCPTSVELLSSATALALYQALTGSEDRSGLYHLASSGATNWHGYAVYLVQRALQLGWKLQARPESVSPAPASDSGRPARRPANSRLSTAKFSAAFGLTPPPWQYYVDRLLWTWSSLRALGAPAPASAGGRAAHLKFIPPRLGPTKPRP